MAPPTVLLEGHDLDYNQGMQAALENVDARTKDQEIPVTERILARLPGPRWVSIAIWSAIPLVGIFLPDAFIATVGPASLPVRVLSGLAFSYATGLALWGVGKFTRETAAAEASLRDVATDPDAGPDPIFRGIGSVAGPLLLATAFVAGTITRTVVEAGASSAVVWLPVSIATNVAGSTGIWVFLAILLGLNRLGSHRLSLDRFPEDPSLGLGEVGHLAFTAFSVYSAAFAIALLPGRTDPFRLAMSLGLFLFGILVFFASVNRLHKQLVRARREHIKWARDLYARVYEPVRSGSLEALERQAHLLAAAEAIERRAEEIQRWPFSARRFRQMMAIVGTMATFVTTGIVTRLILASFDL